jgi:hypothetical protein
MAIRTGLMGNREGFKEVNIKEGGKGTGIKDNRAI